MQRLWASWVMSWVHTRHRQQEGAYRRTLPCGTQILTHRAMNVPSGGASAHSPKTQCTARIHACPTLPSWPPTSTEPHRTSLQAAPQLSPLWPAGQYLLALGVPPPQAQSRAYGNDRQQHRTAYTANPSEQSSGCGSHLPGTPHSQRLTPPHFYKAESIPKMSHWQA